MRYPGLVRARIAGVAVRLRVLIDEERGASAVEYSLIAVLIAAVIFGVVTLLGQHVQSEFGSVVGKF